MKKTVAAAILLTAGVFLSACQGKEPQQKKLPVDVEVWHYYNGAQKEAFDKMVQEFNKTVGNEKGILIRAFSKGGVQELEDSLMNAIERRTGADNLPDISAAYSDSAYMIKGKVPIVDLDPYWTKEEQSEYIQAYVEEGHLGGGDSLNLFPIAKTTEILALNETDWKKFQEATGVSENELATWEGIVRLSETYYQWTDSLTEEPEDGKAFFGRDAFANYMLVGSMNLGHEIFQVKDGIMTLDLDRDAMKKLWDCYYVPYIKGYFASYGKFRSDDVKTGDLVAFAGSNSSMTYFPDSVIKEDGSSYKITGKMYPLPVFAGREKWAVQQGAGMMVFRSDEAHERAAVEFLKWFTEAEHNIRFCAASSYLPVKTEAVSQAETGVAFGENEALPESLRIGLEMSKEYRLYTPPSFKDGGKARKILDESMDYKAKADRKIVQRLISQGSTMEEAVSRFDTEENFQSWYEKILEELEKLEG